MATLKIKPGLDGKVWVSLTRFSAEDLARLKKIPGHRWNPERRQWSFPDTAETRKMLAEMVATPSKSAANTLPLRQRNRMRSHWASRAEYTCRAETNR